MDIKFIFAVLSFGLSAIAYIPYIRDIKQGKAHPTISTWISWLVMDGAILAGMIAQHDVAYQMVAYVIGVVATLYVCIKIKAPLGWKKLDTFCLMLVVLAAAGWAATGDADVAIAISVAAMVIGCVPMLINIYRHPERETLMPWFISWAGGIFGVLAIRNWDIAGALSPIAFGILGAAVTILIARKFLPSPKQLDQILMRD